MRMLAGKSTASGDALGCGVGYGAAPSPQFLPQADIWPLRTPPCPKPTVPPLRVWPRQAIERQGSGSKAPPPAGTQAVGRCQLLFMYRVSVGFFRWADFGCLARRSWLEPKMAYTHLLTQRKSPLLPSLAPLGAMWRLVGLAWAPGGLCPTPPYQLHVRPPRPLASHPLKSPYMPLVSPGRPSQLIFRSK